MTPFPAHLRCQLKLPINITINAHQLVDLRQASPEKHASSFSSSPNRALADQGVLKLRDKEVERLSSQAEAAGAAASDRIKQAEEQAR